MTERGLCRYVARCGFGVAHAVQSFVGVMMQIADAMAYLVTRNVIHRDLAAR
jgi:hypothetical protein